MTEVALAAGAWTSAYDGKTYRKIQILSAQDLPDGKRIEMPHSACAPVFAQTSREAMQPGASQPALLDYNQRWLPAGSCG
jgi:hypothetical protein